MSMDYCDCSECLRSNPRKRKKKRKRITQRDLIEYGESRLQDIARELHDGAIGQLQASFGYSELASMYLKRGDIVQAQQYLGEVMKALSDSVVAIRNIIHGVSPVPKTPGGIIEALGRLTSDISKIFRISCKLEVAGPISLSDNAAATHIYRIVQEAITNAIRHGGADVIVVTLLPEDDQLLTVLVDDNGAGLSSSQLNLKTGSSGFGTTTMKYRAEQLGGTISIDSKGLEGVIVTLHTGPILD